MKRLPVHQLEATGTRDGTKYLRDDGIWETPAGGSGSGVVETIVAGAGIAVDDTDPANPIVSATGGGGGGGSFLTSASYNPTSSVTLSTTSTAFVDADAALSVTFTAPDNGEALIVLSGVAAVSTSGAAQYWNLRDSSGDVAGTSRFVTGDLSNGIQTVHVLLTGLTAGTSYTYKWGYRIHSSSYSARIFAGGDFGPASMFVWSTAA